MNILAVDPGLTTGYCTYLEDHYLRGYFQRGSLEFLDQVFNDIMEGYYDVVICEDYIVTKNTIEKSRQNYSLEIIGTLRFLCHKAGIKFVLQTPSQAKSFATNDKLKKLGWYFGGEGHTDDSARHMMVFCINNNVIKPEVLI